MENLIKTATENIVPAVKELFGKITKEDALTALGWTISGALIWKFMDNVAHYKL